MKIRILILLTAVLSITLTSCKKMLDVQSSRLVSEANMYKSVEDARAGLMGIYGLARAAFCDNDRHWIYGDLRTALKQGGDFRSVTRLDLKSISENKLQAAFPIVESLSDWRRFYAVINAANIFLERAPGIVQSDARYLPQDLKLDVAHARYLRAFAYFYIVRIWGDVPFIITSHDGQFENKPRENQQTVLAFVESELLAAAADLPRVYNANQPEQTRTPYYAIEEEIAKKHSAYAVLAHVYAWQGKYAQAATWAKWVLDNMALPAESMFYMNVDQSRQMFRGEYGTNQFNIIAGFSHMFLNAESGSSGFLEELTLAAPYVINKPLPAIYVPKDSILSIFNLANDQRFSIDRITSSPTSDKYFGAFDRTYPIFTKVFIIRDNNPPVNTVTGNGSDGSMTQYASSVVFTRPEDMALLLAEARVVLGDAAGATQLLNERRSTGPGNRGLTLYDPLVDGSLIDAIFKERRKELMGEGWRWYDLIRYKRIKNNDPAFNALIQNGGIYWPVSKAVLAQNPLLEQTTYWK
ncbi:MAG TPA: RagB/SusD family nutrient uptake outer membrane protein [Pedobacter sp.]|uniref:RagB/SusD family nutrient uptake outer membrane protein n=1 Tax=Pedobacter sp. TaxID=1411316 RepID=UPI002D1B2B98|nr:RagB/SusD family nutrient uptake outer membrane protein [Pedobacter sp.]HMI02813.1 RagB/SusD family nutrient uptake outer membrane protein [Pedobacter sp.]